MVESYLSAEDQEKKKKEKLKKRDLESHRRSVETDKLKMDLHNLQALVEQGVIDQDLLDEIKKDTDVSHEELSDIVNSVDVQQIFAKMEEMETLPDIDKVLPREMRVTKKEYLQALQDPNKRPQVLQKLDTCLNALYVSSRPSGLFKRSVFGAFVYILDKKLLFMVQEHIIDMKHNLLP